MRTKLLVLACLASSMAAQESKIPHSTCTNHQAEAAARQIAEDWKNGYNDNDAAKVAALYADDADYLTQHFISGIVHGRDKIQAYVQRGIDARYHIDSITILSLDCSGDLAFTVGKYESTNGGQKAFGVNLVVLKRLGKQWRIVAHESAVPDPATAVRQLESPTSK